MQQQTQVTFPARREPVPDAPIVFSHPTSTRTALVTGASAGIGREMAGVLARNGFNVVLVSRCGAQLEQLADELRQSHRIRAHAIARDLSTATAICDLYEEFTDSHLNIDLLVNNAAFAIQGEFVESDLQEQLRLLQLNIVSLTHLTRLLLPRMIEKRWGRILNVSSIAAFVPGPLMATYNASKAYVSSFSAALANELRGTGVTVTTLCPGPTRTSFADRAGLSTTRAFPQSHGPGRRCPGGLYGADEGQIDGRPGISQQDADASPAAGSAKGAGIFFSQIP